MPSAYEDYDNGDGYSALDIIDDMYGDYDNANESDRGYFPIDYLGDMYGDYDNGDHKKSKSSGQAESSGRDHNRGYFAMDVLAEEMPGLYGDHGDGGWWQGDIVASLTPDPYDPMEAYGLSVGASASGGSGSSPSGGSGEGEETNEFYETNFPYDTYLTQMD